MMKKRRLSRVLQHDNNHHEQPNNTTLSSPPTYSPLLSSHLSSSSSSPPPIPPLETTHKSNPNDAILQVSMTPLSPSNIPSPPTFDAFLLLRHFLSSLPPPNRPPPPPSSKQQSNSSHLHTILRTLDFLFDSSFVEATLSVLDTHHHSIIEESTSPVVAAVRLIRTPSNRSMYLLRASSSPSMQYMVRLSERRVHCTCRSFFEKSKQSCRSVNVVCKHVEAALLALYLNESYYQEVEVEEEEFVSLCLMWSVVS
mmetsp:Transcript_2796/g.3963  ORF Transcript_2796/g.3963 Transcript_2796/m.3963 type:complete len:254 (+) Transcript_2796:198-959(+)